MGGNRDEATVAAFDSEWSTFNQTALPADERQALFDAYFSIFPFNALPPDAEGFDLGCGTGRWAAMVAPRVGTLHCIDPAPAALAVAREAVPAAQFHVADVDQIPLPDDSQDFGYSLGVLHHLPDPQAGLASCVRKLKRGAPFLLYVYYALENRPAWFRGVWKVSDVMRKAISRMPFPLRKAAADLLAVGCYWPLSRAAFSDRLPLFEYRKRCLYSLRTDALDRFGTPIERRFTKVQIRDMMAAAGLHRIRFSEAAPYWTAVGFKAPADPEPALR